VSTRAKNAELRELWLHGLWRLTIGRGPGSGETTGSGETMGSGETTGSGEATGSGETAMRGERRVYVVTAVRVGEALGSTM